MGQVFRMNMNMLLADRVFWNTQWKDHTTRRVAAKDSDVPGSRVSGMYSNVYLMRT
jgi:hypothetical protein